MIKISNSVLDISEVSGKEMYQIMKDLCAFGYRIAGTPAADKAEKYIFQKFKDMNLPEVKLEPFNFTRWWAEKYELTIISENTPLVASDHSIKCFPIHFGGTTGPEGIVAEVIYAGYGTATDLKTIDVKDKIVLIDGNMIFNFFPTWQLFRSIDLAKKQGAVGLIVNNGSPLDSISYTFLLEGVEGWNERIPALSVNTEDGNYLKYFCIRKPRKLMLKLVEDVKTETATSNIVLGTIPGKSDDIVLVGTHTDSTFTGAVDNAGANAGLIALAKHYNQIPLEQRKKTIVFAGWTGHEAALLGSKKFVEMHKDMLDKITTFIMLDGFGSDGWYNQTDGGAVKTEQDEKRGLFVSANPVLAPFVIDAALKYKLMPATYVSAKALPVSDLGPFIRAKVPSILFIGKPIWYHTIYDTPDKCTPEQLERCAKAHIHVIDKILETPTSQIKEADGTLTDATMLITEKKEFSLPLTSFSVTPHPIIKGTPAIFHIPVFSINESIIIDITWDFGDGKQSKIPLTVHNYRKEGTYEVTLQVIDNYGNTITSKQPVRVIKKNV